MQSALPVAAMPVAADNSCSHEPVTSLAKEKTGLRGLGNTKAGFLNVLNDDIGSSKQIPKGLLDRMDTVCLAAEESEAHAAR